jgi:hypothetical protein
VEQKPQYLQWWKPLTKRRWPMSIISVFRTPISSGHRTIAGITPSSVHLARSVANSFLFFVCLFALLFFSNRTFSVVILEDQLPEDLESFRVVIRSVSSGATIGTKSFVIVTIAANDQYNHSNADVVEVKVRLLLDSTLIPAGTTARQTFMINFM